VETKPFERATRLTVNVLCQVY